MIRRLSILIALVCAAGGALGGCASEAVRGDGLALGETRPARGGFVLAEVFPWTDSRKPKPTKFEIESGDGVWVTRYEVLEGPRAGGVMVETRRVGASPEEWLVERRFERDGQAQEERRLRLEEPQGLVMEEMKNFERGVRVEMHPAGLAVPSRLEPGHTAACDVKMRLPLLNNPRKLREKGSGHAEISLTDEQPVPVRDGTIDALRLREVFTSRLSAATAVRTIDRWFAKGRGLIAERWVEEVTVLGVVIERSRQTIRVLPPGGAEASKRE